MKTISKKAILILSLLLLVVSTFTNAQELIGKLYQAKVPILVRKIYPPAESRAEGSWHDTCEASKNYIFQVVDIKDNTVIIRWWDFTDSSKPRQDKKINLRSGADFELISYKNSHLNYEISLADLNSKCAPYYGNENSFTWGAITMPVKLRLGNKSDRYFSFQESLNIGVAAGWRWQKQGRHQKSRNILFSVGVSNVALDSLDFTRDGKNERYVPNVKTTAAFTLAAGYVFQFENFQVGAFTGLDILPYELGRQWLHRGRPWLGIGLGMTLFSRDKQSGGSGKNVEK